MYLTKFDEQYQNLKNDIESFSPLVVGGLHDFYVKMQRNVDITTNSILNHINENNHFIELIKKNHEDVVAAILIPTIHMRATDIAPTYDTYFKIIWYLCSVSGDKQSNRYLNHFKPEVNDLIEERTKELYKIGYNIYNVPPPLPYESIILDVLNHNKIIEKYGILVKDNI